MQSSMQLNQGSKQHFKLSKSSLNNKFKHKDPKNTHTHTHTLNKSNQFYISKTKLRQFSEHTLTYVNLMTAKSYCTCTCIKSSKEFCVLCVENIVRLQMCQHVMMIWDMRNHYNSYVLEVLKTPKTIQLQAKCVLSKDYPITTKNFTYVLNM